MALSNSRLINFKARHAPGSLLKLLVEIWMSLNDSVTEFSEVLPPHILICTSWGGGVVVVVLIVVPNLLLHPILPSPFLWMLWTNVAWKVMVHIIQDISGMNGMHNIKSYNLYFWRLLNYLYIFTFTLGTKYIFTTCKDVHLVASFLLEMEVAVYPESSNYYHITSFVFTEQAADRFHAIRWLVNSCFHTASVVAVWHSRVH